MSQSKLIPETERATYTRNPPDGIIGKSFYLLFYVYESDAVEIGGLQWQLGVGEESLNGKKYLYVSIIPDTFQSRLWKMEFTVEYILHHDYDDGKNVSQMHYYDLRDLTKQGCFLLPWEEMMDEEKGFIEGDQINVEVRITIFHRQRMHEEDVEDEDVEEDEEKEEEDFQGDEEAMLDDDEDDEDEDDEEDEESDDEDDDAAKEEEANRAITLEFVEKELSYFGCKFEGGEEFVDILNWLAQSLQLEAYDLIKWTLMLAWIQKTTTMDVLFLYSFERVYKNPEHALAWASFWDIFNRMVDGVAQLYIADDAEEQPPAMEYAAAVDEEANRARAVKIVFSGGLHLVPVEEDEMILDENEGRQEMPIRTRPTPEQIGQAQALRELDQIDPDPTCFSRACLICATKNPRKRAVFIEFGHIVCYPCAVENARSDATDGHCVFCRSTGGFVMLFEEEEYGRNESDNDIIENDEV